MEIIAFIASVFMSTVEFVAILVLGAILEDRMLRRSLQRRGAVPIFTPFFGKSGPWRIVGHVERARQRESWEHEVWIRATNEDECELRRERKG